MKSISMLAAAVVSASLLLPTVSEAATPDQVIVSEQVSYGDLDLATEAGQTTLQRRIDASIRRVCADDGSRDLHALLGFRECVKQAKVKSGEAVRLALAQKVNRDRA